MWVASAALPPLPNRRSFPPRSSASAIVWAACTIGATRPPSSRASPVAMHSRTAATAIAIASASVSNVSPPRAQPRVLERELLDARPQLTHPCRHLVLAIGAAVEQQVPPAAGSRDLAAQCTGDARRGIQILDPLIRDPVRHALLGLPRGIQEVAEIGQPPLKQSILHFQGKLLLSQQSGGGVRVASVVASHLVFDDV